MKNKAAVIVDEFTLENLKDHWLLYQVDFHDSLELIEQFKPNLLFVESVWNGVNGSWRGLFGAKSRKLQQLVEFCKQHAIPTVFWNKEDPVHFDDFTERCDIAGWFDFIFSTELDCVGDYATRYPRSRCFVLPFFYNENKYTAKTVKNKSGYFFAGTYYKKFPDRNIAFDQIVAYLEGQNTSISIYDRNYGTGQKDLEFPDQYSQFIKGKVEPGEMVSVYQDYQYCINLNTVQNGQTMFARRVIESLACSTPVLSNYSRALDVLFNSQRRFIANNIVEYQPKHCSAALEGLTSQNAISFIESIVLSSVLPTEGIIAALNLQAGYERITLESFEHTVAFIEPKVNRVELTCRLEADTLYIQSYLMAEQHGYINFANEFDVQHKSHVHFLFESSSSLALLDIWLLDAQGEIVFRNIYSRTQDISIGVPSDAFTLKIAIRVAGAHLDLVCKLALGKKIKIPKCIIPLNENYCVVRGDLTALNDKLSHLCLANTEVLYYTGNDFDFSYQIVQGYSVIVGGDLVKSAVEAGRIACCYSLQ
ncbi:hypothetical protein WH43_10195 [Rheinheimera sp. KL1]|uniref:glycosyltransferase family protein n=1 Tax=Rheinheimera sp. KL1 TaxID=1635005 RepID=UPI0006A94D96|nr:glycosyltransferase [Rheinheimera sp. KL1]KOO58149.1 hypothetical protein WH43_10195 [Rheinheimera sp. KL1]